MATANKSYEKEIAAVAASATPYPHRGIQVARCKRILDIDTIESCTKVKKTCGNYNNMEECFLTMIGEGVNKYG